jgi:hypothetical protein
VIEFWTLEQITTALGPPINDELPGKRQDVVDQTSVFPGARHVHWNCGCRAASFAPRLDLFHVRRCDTHIAIRPPRK